jgi:hypothetical protein
LPLAAAMSEQSLTPKNALDGAGARERRNFFLLESATHGRGAELAQGAVGLEPRAEGNDALRQTLWGLVVRPRIAARTILPIDAIETQTLRAVKPAMSGVEADQEAASDGTKRGTATQCSNDESSLEAGFFSAMAEPFVAFEGDDNRRDNALSAAAFPQAFSICCR